MNQFFKTAALHKIAIAFIALFSVNSLCTTALAALSGVEWAESSNQVRCMIVIAIIGNWTNVLLAFFRDALAKLFRGENPLITKP